MSIPNYPLGQGLRPYLLRHLREIVKDENLPQTKIEHVGLLNLLQSSDKPQILRLNNAAGHKESVQVKYLQRYTKDYAGTNEADVCNNTLFDAYREATANLNVFRFIPLHLDDEVVAQYEDDASSYFSEGTPPTTLMKEMIERIMTAANAVLSGIDADLMTILAANVGVNRATGNNAAKSVNFPLNTTNNPLNSGTNEVLSDAAINLFGSGELFALCAPGGLWHKYMLQQGSKGIDQSGVNTTIQAGGFMTFPDAEITSALGSINEALIIKKNTVQIVEYMRFTGFKAGAKPGASVFGTIKLPMQVGQDVLPVEFDYQLRYNDCTTTLTDQYYGTPITVQKGFTLILSKKCGLFQVPSDAYRAIDPNVSVNGVLRYAFTNV